MTAEKSILAAAVAAASIAGAAAQQPLAALDGTWIGALKVGSQTLALVLNVAATDGKPGATLDSPDQGVMGITVSSISMDGSKVAFESSAIKAFFEGTLSADGKSIAGTWKQGGSGFPLKLEKGAPGAVTAVAAAAAVPKRPQEPVPPFPYRTEEVVVENAKAGVRLAGTLTIPSAKGAALGEFPALVMVTGSGQQDRDESLLGHRPFLVIADYLARRGVMTLRCDDRGFGSSTGDASNATTLDFADDAEAAFEYLASRSEAKKGAVGILGHSEGGLIAPIVASRDAKVGFIVLLAGPGLRGEEILYLQAKAIAKAQGASDKDIESAMSLNRQLYALVQKWTDEAALKAEARKAFIDWAAASPAMKGQDTAAIEANADATVAQLFVPWFREFLALDPAPYLASVGAPVLALFGTKDLQVPSKQNAAALKAALGSKAPGGPSSKSAIVELPGLNHLFQTALSGSPDEYAKIEETFSPEAMKRVADWILGL
jgi:uncharacterized protein